MKKTNKQKIKIALKKLLKDKQKMHDLSIMTHIMFKLNAEEQRTLMRFNKIIEDNARHDERMRIWEFMFRREPTGGKTNEK